MGGKDLLIDDYIKKAEIDLEIDNFSLDKECSRQPILYLTWSKFYGAARYEQETEKDNLRLLEAEITNDIRADPEKYGIMGKPTNDAVLSKLIVQKRILEQQQLLREKNHIVNVLGGIVNAFEQRRRMLENEVSLFLSGYFASPKLKGGKGEKLDDLTRQDMENSLEEKYEVRKRSKK